MDAREQRGGRGGESLGVDSQHAQKLGRADDAIGGALPFPAADAGDALRAIQMPRQAPLFPAGELGRVRVPP